MKKGVERGREKKRRKRMKKKRGERKRKIKKRKRNSQVLEEAQDQFTTWDLLGASYKGFDIAQKTAAAVQFLVWWSSAIIAKKMPASHTYSYTFILITR